jgi:hypothetical protein
MSKILGGSRTTLALSIGCAIGILLLLGWSLSHPKVNSLVGTFARHAGTQSDGDLMNVHNATLGVSSMLFINLLRGVVTFST